MIGIVFLILLALFGIGFLVGLKQQAYTPTSSVEIEKGTQVTLQEAVLDDEAVIFLEEILDALENFEEEKKEIVVKIMQEAEVDQKELELAEEIKRLVGQA